MKHVTLVCERAVLCPSRFIMLPIIARVYVHVVVHWWSALRMIAIAVSVISHKNVLHLHTLSMHIFYYAYECVYSIRTLHMYFQA